MTAPIVSGFSTGKSSLINAILGEKLLSTNISPETAVPTELLSGNDVVTLVSASGAEKTVPLSDFNSDVLSASKYSVVKIASSNAFLKDIPSIKLVDMPGFDSGIEAHNRAIDNYLPQSLAYIVTVSADEGTLRASIINFLNELKLYSVPVYTVITKSAKASCEDVDKLKAHISESLTRFLKIDNPKIAVTSAKGNVDVEEFRSFLTELQSNSDDIFNKHFSGRLNAVCERIEKYLLECLDKDDMTLDELRLQKEQAERAFEDVGKKFDAEKERFHRQVEQCVSSIKSKINADLESSRSTIEGLILQNQEDSVREKINSIIRNAYAYVVQTELEAKIKRYAANVKDMVDVDIYNASSKLPEENIEIDNQIKQTLSTAAQTVAPTLGAYLGTVLMPGLGTVIGAVIGAAANILINVGFNAKQKFDRQKIAKEKASEIIEATVNESGDKITSMVYQCVDKINESLSAEIERERALKAKALSDCEENLRLESNERERKAAELTADLETIRRIINADR